MVWVVLLLWQYLDGFIFTVWADPNAIKWILKLTDLTGKLGRWRRPLAEFALYAVHRTRRKPQVTESLLLLKITGTDQTPIEDKKPIL